MQQMSGPPIAPLRPDGHLLQPVHRWASEQPTRAVAAYRQGGEFVQLSWKELPRPHLATRPRARRLETGELTPTLEVRRAVVESTYAGQIDALYGS